MLTILKHSIKILKRVVIEMDNNQKRTTIYLSIIFIVILVGTTIISINNKKQVQIGQFDKHDGNNFGIEVNGPVTDKDIDNLLNDGQEFVVYFYMDNCEGCENMNKTLNEISKKRDLDIKYFNTAEHDYSIYDVEFVPTMIHFKDGNVEDRLEGQTDIDSVTKFLDNIGK